MLPRCLYLRRCFLYVIGFTCFIFIISNFRHNIGHDTNSASSSGKERPALKRPDLPSANANTQPTAAPRYAALQKTVVQQSNSILPVEEHEMTLAEIMEDIATSDYQPRDQPKEAAKKSVAGDVSERPWYMKGGSRLPAPAKVSRKTGRRVARLWPQEEPAGDRVTNQLMFVPPDNRKKIANKKILLFNGLGTWGVKAGSEAFKNCPVDSCTITSNRAESMDADAIFFKDHFVHPGHHKPHRQVWALYFLECPYHTQHIKYNDVFNWTATYRRDSDIVAPYERWEYHDWAVTEWQGPPRDFTLNKTHKVAWFVSNCAARNNRLQYAHELAKHIQVDIYGACGRLNCPRSAAEKCFEMLDTKYKFYLAFENSNCKDYITEKFFVNGLGRNVLPIVMGAPPEDYEKSAPKHSYIHVDDFESPKQLAEYLHKLDKDDDLYNSYFKWKGMGEFINTHFFCRVCAMVHDDYPTKSYRDINEWWRGAGVCTSGSWRKSKGWSHNNKVHETVFQ